MLYLISRLTILLIGISLFICPTATSAQLLGGPKAQATAPRKDGMLTAFRTTFALQHFVGSATGDDFNLDADVLLDFDIVDFGRMRINAFASSETVIGSEFRMIDPNQNNYILDLSMFFRLPHGELSTTIHHVSGHLIDRARRMAVSWNMIGLAYGDSFSIGQFLIDASLRGMGTVGGLAGVDYRGQFEGHVNMLRQINSRFAVIAGASGVVVPVDFSIFGRTKRTGGRLEGGVRLLTKAGSIDVFAAWEQRIDAVTTARKTSTWPQVGMRLSTHVP